MSDPLESVKEVLNDLEATLHNIKKSCGSIFEETYWTEKHTQCWLHGATELIERYKQKGSGLTPITNVRMSCTHLHNSLIPDAKVDDPFVLNLNKKNYKIN